MKKVIVNAIGEPCPIPVVKATKALAQMDGGTLEVHVDNEVAVQNVLRMAGSRGLEAISEQKEEKHYVITMIAGVPADTTAETPCCTPLAGGTVVAVGTAAMGTGNDDLGKTLMKGFLYALSQLETLPETILFYNGGARIPVEGSVSVEDLKEMEAQGVKIMTCGTCLDFYGLKDKPAVGSVTNMYQIVETLSHASKVIKP